MITLNEVPPVVEFDKNQTTLINALLGSKHKKEDYLKAWTDTVDFENIEHPNFKMLPLLQQQFIKHNTHNPYHTRMQGIHKYYYVRNNIHLNECKNIIEQLAAASIDFIVMKGLAMSLKYYESSAYRWMGDVDILIQPCDLPQAMKIVESNGWNKTHSDEVLANSYIPHGVDYTKDKVYNFDLHIYSLYETPIDGTDDNIWQRALPYHWDGMDIKIMSAEDLIFNTIVNALREITYWNVRTCDIAWMCDVMTVLAADPHIDWDIIFSEAKNRSLSETVYHGLVLLKQHTQQQIFTDLIDKFSTDNKILLHHLKLKNTFQQGQQAEITYLKNELLLTKTQLDTEKKSAVDMRNELSVIYNSRSWRWTSALRQCFSYVCRARCLRTTVK